MFCAFHHLIVDVVSPGASSSAICSGCIRGIAAGKGTSYRQWGERLRQYAATRQDQCAYWLAMIAGQPDYATLSGVTQAPEFCRFECDVALTALLMDGCHGPTTPRCAKCC